MVLLRNFQITDMDELVELEMKVFPEGPYDYDLLHNVFTQKGSVNEIAMQDGKIVGYIVALPLDENVADIESIAVDPDHAREGIGTVLLRSIERKCMALGTKRFILEVREKNEEAIQFYEKLGYKKMEFVKNYYIERYRGSRGAFRMVKVPGSPGVAGLL